MFQGHGIVSVINYVKGKVFNTTKSREIRLSRNRSTLKQGKVGTTCYVLVTHI